MVTDVAAGREKECIAEATEAVGAGIVTIRGDTLDHYCLDPGVTISLQSSVSRGAAGREKECVAEASKPAEAGIVVIRGDTPE